MSTNQDNQAVIEWMESLGFEHTKDLGTGLMSNHKVWLSKSNRALMFFDEQADFFYRVMLETKREARLLDSHDWDVQTFKKQGVIACRRCATTYQTRGNKPCKGKMAKVALRSAELFHPTNTKVSDSTGLEEES